MFSYWTLNLCHFQLYCLFSILPSHPSNTHTELDSSLQLDDPEKHKASRLFQPNSTSSENIALKLGFGFFLIFKSHLLSIYYVVTLFQEATIPHRPQRLEGSDSVCQSCCWVWGHRAWRMHKESS